MRSFGKEIFLKSLLFSASLMIILCMGCHSDDEDKKESPQEEAQITLYDVNKEAIAYIDYEDEATIYTFDGEPVAYIKGKEQVYGFNGRLLGWYHDGVLYHYKTYLAVAAKHGIVRGGINTAVTRPEKIKGIKKLKPLESFEENDYESPLLLDSWSTTTLTDFFADGKK